MEKLSNEVYAFDNVYDDELMTLVFKKQLLDTIKAFIVLFSVMTFFMILSLIMNSQIVFFITLLGALCFAILAIFVVINNRRSKKNFRKSDIYNVIIKVKIFRDHIYFLDTKNGNVSNIEWSRFKIYNVYKDAMMLTLESNALFALSKKRIDNPNIVDFLEEKMKENVKIFKGTKNRKK